VLLSTLRRCRTPPFSPFHELFVFFEDAKGVASLLFPSNSGHTLIRIADFFSSPHALSSVLFFKPELPPHFLWLCFFFSSFRRSGFCYRSHLLRILTAFAIYTPWPPRFGLLHGKFFTSFSTALPQVLPLVTARQILASRFFPPYEVPPLHAGRALYPFFFLQVHFFGGPPSFLVFFFWVLFFFTRSRSAASPPGSIPAVDVIFRLMFFSVPVAPPKGLTLGGFGLTLSFLPRLRFAEAKWLRSSPCTETFFCLDCHVTSLVSHFSI